MWKPDTRDLVDLVQVAAQSERANVRLKKRRPNRIVTFGLQSTTYLQFVEDLAIAWGEAFPRDVLVFAHGRGSEAYMLKHQPALHARSEHVPLRGLQWSMFRESDLYVTATCYGPTVALPTVYIAHGQPSKRQSFTYEALSSLDTVFLLGPFQLRALAEYLDDVGRPLPPHLRLVPTGYGKSDAVLNGRHDAAAVAREWGLDPSRPTVLYAPAFNEGASLREFGPDLVASLLTDERYNVIAKLPEDVFEPNAPTAYTGGRDWRAMFLDLERRHPNFRLVREYRVDRALAVADVLVTCVSSVSFEMLALGKPVLFVKTPRFFEHYLRSLFPNEYTPEWARRVTINGGQDYGTVVEDYRELAAATRDAIAHPERHVRPRAELQQELLYHPGRALEVMLRNFDVLLNSRQGTRRSTHRRVFLNQIELNLRGPHPR